MDVSSFSELVVNDAWIPLTFFYEKMLHTEMHGSNYKVPWEKHQ